MDEKTKKYVVWGAVAVVAMQLLGVNVLSPGGGSPSPAPVVVNAPGVPSAELQAAVAGVLELSKQKPEAALALAPFYRGGAEVVRRDTGNIGSASQFTSARTTANKLFLEHTPLVGSLPGLGKATDDALTKGMGGMADVSLDDANRKKLADILDAIGWALEGGHG